MVKTVSKLFRKLIRVISDKTVPKSVYFMKWHVKFPIFMQKMAIVLRIIDYVLKKFCC
jgi:hypothetical protein